MQERRGATRKEWRALADDGNGADLLTRPAPVASMFLSETSCIIECQISGHRRDGKRRALDRELHRGKRFGCKSEKLRWL